MKKIDSFIFIKSNINIMRVAFYSANKNLKDIDFSRPDIGNPGCGATEYLQIAIPYMLKKHYGDLFESIILADNVNTLPKDIESHSIQGGVHKSILKAKELKIDIFVFKPSMSEPKETFLLINKNKLNTIAIGQLTPNPKCIDFLAECNFIKAFVCVGLNQFDQLIDTKLSSKLFQINNPIIDNLIQDKKNITSFRERKDIVFMGALYPQKNFYYLAKNWHLINKKIPSAKLHVIGSANTYGNQIKLGNLGLAEKSYEELFMGALNQDKRSAQNVIFHGNLDEKKYQFFSNCRVGIVNPLGTTETCCVSAVEMQAFGLPICTGNYQALKTTVLNRRSGLLSSNNYKFRENIVKVYNDKILFDKLSQGALFNAKLNFSFSQILYKWNYLFFKVFNEDKIKTSYYPSSFSRKFNFIYGLRLINKNFFQEVLKLRTKSLISNIDYLKKLRRRFINKFPH